MFELFTPFDLSVLFWIQEHLEHPILTRFFRLITRMGNGGIFPVLLVLLLIRFYKPRRVGSFCAIAMFLQALIINLIAKPFFGRMRPYEYSPFLIPLTNKLYDFSFPSGHTGVCSAIFFTCLFLKEKRLSILTGIFLVLMACSRLYLRMHYPTDVLGGFLIGFFSAFLAMKIGPILEKRLTKNRDLP